MASATFSGPPANIIVNRREPVRWAKQLGMPGEIVPGKLPAFLGDGGRHHGIDNFFIRRFDGVVAKTHGCFTTHFAGGTDGGAEHAVLIVIDHDHILRVRPQAAIELVTPPEDVKLGNIGCVVQQLIHAIDNEPSLMAKHGVGEGFDNHLRADSCRVSQRDRDGRSVRSFHGLRLWPGGSREKGKFKKSQRFSCRGE